MSETFIPLLISIIFPHGLWFIASAVTGTWFSSLLLREKKSKHAIIWLTIVALFAWQAIFLVLQVASFDLSSIFKPSFIYSPALFLLGFFSGFVLDRLDMLPGRKRKK